MRRPLLLVILALASLVAAPAAAPDPFEVLPAPLPDISQPVRWRILDFAKDDSGQIWGIGRREDLEDGMNDAEVARRLVVFDEATISWQEPAWQGLPEGGEPEALVRLEQGAVSCYWSMNERGAVTLHRDNRSHLFGWLKGAITEPRLLALTDGGLVITGKGPAAFRLGGPAPAQAAVLRLPDEWLLPPPGSDSDTRNYAGLHAMEMADGSLRLWHYATAAPTGWWRLSGMVTWRKDGASFLTNQPLAAEAPIMALASGNDGSLLAAAAGRGLMRIDPPTGLWVDVFPPDTSRRYVEQMFSTADNGYFITAPPPTSYEAGMSAVLQSHLSLVKTKHYDSSQRTGSLWKHGPEAGTLTEVVQGLDWEPGTDQMDRAVLETARGILIGSHDSGPWWLPAAAGARPWRLEREDGFTLGSAAGFLTLGDQGFLTRQRSGFWQFLPWPGDAPQHGPTRLAEILTGDFLVQDSRFGLWGFSAGAAALVHWDGKAWSTADLLQEVRDRQQLEFAGDGHDQGWLIPLEAGRTPILNFRTGEWQHFDTLEQAVEVRLMAGDRVDPRRRITFALLAHENGTKGFIDWSGRVHVWRGGAWHTSSLTDIGGDGARVTGVPFFGGDGRFCVSLNHRHYQFDGGGQWSARIRPDDFQETNRAAEDAGPPAGFPHRGVVSTCYDRHGVAWVLLLDGTLWKWLDGVLVPVMDHGRSLVLPPNSRGQEVLTDAAGNAFLRHEGAGDVIRYLGIQPDAMKSPGPAAAVVAGLDAVRLVMPPEYGGWWRWRVAGKSWNKLAKAPEVTLSGLAAGAWRWEIQSFNEELSADGPAQEVTAEIKAVAGHEIGKLIEQLAAPDVEGRETAARVLRSQGAAAVPALKQALALAAAGDDESLTWWLRAVLQQVEPPSKEK